MIFLIHFLVLSLSEEADNYNSTNSTNTTNETTYLKVGDKCNEESLIEDGLICCNSIVFDQNDVNESCLPPNKVGMYSGKQTIMHFIFIFSPSIIFSILGIILKLCRKDYDSFHFSLHYIALEFALDLFIAVTIFHILFWNWEFLTALVFYLRYGIKMFLDSEYLFYPIRIDESLGLHVYHPSSRKFKIKLSYFLRLWMSFCCYFSVVDFFMYLISNRYRENMKDSSQKEKEMKELSKTLGIDMEFFH